MPAPVQNCECAWREVTYEPIDDGRVSLQELQRSDAAAAMNAWSMPHSVDRGSAILAPVICVTMCAMTLRAIDHVQLAMPPGQEVQAIAFYETLLGLPRVDKPGHLAGRGGCWFESDSVKIHLGVEADFRPARKAHPGLVVDGLHDLVERLRSAGVTVHTDEPLEGYEHVYVDDPFGNRLELLEPASRDGR